MKRLLFATILAAGVWPVAARAAPYWVAWEGNDYPENEGWRRINDGIGPAVRTLQDGAMNLDGLWDTQVDDFYRIDRQLNAEPGETFVMQWRVRVNEIIAHPLFPFDPGLGFYTDDDWALSFDIGIDRIRSHHEELEFPFTPLDYHAFELQSADMRTYVLTIDGVSVHAGSFWEPASSRSYIGWGDSIRGAASNSDWDYFRFGVVPEPTTATLLFVLFFAARIVTATRRFA